MPGLLGVTGGVECHAVHKQLMLCPKGFCNKLLLLNPYGCIHAPYLHMPGALHTNKVAVATDGIGAFQLEVLKERH